jgi:hypothetical protein
MVTLKLWQKQIYVLWHITLLIRVHWNCNNIAFMHKVKNMQVHVKEIFSIGENNLWCKLEHQQTNTIKIILHNIADVASSMYVLKLNICRRIKCKLTWFANLWQDKWSSYFYTTIMTNWATQCELYV